MSSAPNLNDAERGIPEQEPFPIPLPLPMHHLESSSSSPSIAKPTYPLTSSLPLPPLPLEKQENSPQNARKREMELFRVAVSVIVAAPPRKKQRKKEVSRWTRVNLWFNTYRSALVCHGGPLSHRFYICRKFFTFVMVLNLVGILLAALNIWNYPRKYTGALVLGNLFAAILIRNELFGRFLYFVVNTLFAKVCWNYNRGSARTVKIGADYSLHSGHRCGSDLVAPRFSSTSAEFTPDAQHLASFGLSSRSSSSSSNTDQTTM